MGGVRGQYEVGVHFHLGVCAACIARCHADQYGDCPGALGVLPEVLQLWSGTSKIATLKAIQDVHEEPPKYRVFSIEPGIIHIVTSSKSKISEQDTGKHALLCSQRVILCPNADLCLLYSQSPARFLRVAGQYRIRFRPQENAVGKLECGPVECQKGRHTDFFLLRIELSGW